MPRPYGRGIVARSAICTALRDPTTLDAMKRGLAGILITATLATTALTVANPPVNATTPSTALVYGDSLTFESRYAIATEINTHPGWTVTTRAFGGTAPCDWIGWLPQDLITYHPSIVAIETVGNYARPCMIDPNGVALVPGTTAYYAKITADLSTMIRTITATGAQVVFVKGPPMLDPAWNMRVTKINANTVKLAKTLPRVSVTGKPRAAVSANGRYVAYKACLSGETAAMGCDAGQIAIRTVNGLQVGIHFCPDGLIPGYACGVYSSGEYRFGRSIAKALIKR